MRKTEWLVVVLVAPLVLTSCAPSRQAQMAALDAHLTNAARAHVEPLLGHEYWIRLNQQVKLYQNDDGLGPYTVATGKVTFDAIARDPAGGAAWVHVTTSTGQSGFISVPVINPLLFFSVTDPMAGAVYPSSFSHLKETDKRRSLSGIVLGMTEDQVLASAWGKPESTKETKKAESDKDAWYYHDGSTLFFNYGRLYEIQK